MAAATAMSTPRFRSIGFMPAATDLRLRARWLGQNRGGGGAVTGDVIGLRGNFAHHLGAIFSNLSSSSISFATVTPSLVVRGAPKDFSMTTLRPFGPSVTFTALARYQRAEHLLAGIA